MPFGSGSEYRRIRDLMRYISHNPLGSHFFVNSAHANAGTSSAHGYTPDAPLTTIDAAVALCTANAGDTIHVGPGHVETVSAAGGLDLDVAGITVKGYGSGTLQPKIDFTTATTADVDIDAANITIENFQFEASFADIAAAIDVNADDFTIRNCRFLEPTTDENVKIWIQDAAAGGSDRITVEDCLANSPDAANTHFINFAGTGDGHIVRRNTLIGDWGTACIGGAGVITNAVITDNDVCNKATDNDACINLAATATGIVHRNQCSGGAAQANGITATGTSQNENYYGVISEDLQGILDPIVT